MSARRVPLAARPPVLSYWGGVERIGPHHARAVAPLGSGVPRPVSGRGTDAEQGVRPIERHARASLGRATQRR
jgi:hypothetical protein